MLLFDSIVRLFDQGIVNPNILSGPYEIQHKLNSNIYVISYRDPYSPGETEALGEEGKSDESLDNSTITKTEAEHNESDNLMVKLDDVIQDIESGAVNRWVLLKYLEKPFTNMHFVIKKMF